MGKISALMLALLMACIAVTSPLTAFSQNSKVEWSSVSSGFGPEASATSRVLSSVGEEFVGGSRLVNTEIEGGLIAGVVFRGVSSGVSGQSTGLPVSFSLSQNYPNPFNPTTGIRFSVPPQAGRDGQVPGVSDVRLVVYDILGREVATLVNERKAAGRYEVRFDGSGLASGMYIYRMTAGSFVETKKMILLK